MGIAHVCWSKSGWMRPGTLGTEMEPHANSPASEPPPMFHTETWFPSIQTVSQDPCKVEWLRGTGLRQASGGTARCLRTPSRTSTTSFTRMSVVSADSYSSISSGASTNGSTVSDRPPERRPAYEPSGTKWFERDGVRFGALLSGDGAHRFTLVREWNRARPRLLWIGLNPSTADAFTTDPLSTPSQN